MSELRLHRRLLRGLALLRSPWFYWYRGRRLVALSGMGLGLGVTGLYVVLTAGVAVAPLVLALALDHLLIVFIVLYVLLRWSAPTWIPLDWADWFMAEQVLLIAVPAMLLTRLCTLGVVRFVDSRAAPASCPARAADDPADRNPSCRAEGGGTIAHPRVCDTAGL